MSNASLSCCNDVCSKKLAAWRPQLKTSTFFVFLVLATGLGVGGCASAPKGNTVVEADQVLGRSDERKERPDWVTETVSVREKGSKIQFYGVVEVPGDSRAQAAFKMSDAAARGQVANKVETNVLKLVESSESGLKMEDQSLKLLIHEMSQVSLTNVDIKDRYWEKVRRTASDGVASVVMKSFSLIEIEKADLQKLMLERGKQASAPKDLKNKVESLVRSKWQDSEVTE